MKKTYIKPETIVVALNVKENLMEPSLNSGDAKTYNEETRPVQMNRGDGLGREVIRSRGAWEEW